jgi:hypothetical protein
MARVWVSLLVLGCWLAATAQQKQKSDSDIAVLNAIAHRTEGRITIDGQVRNAGDRAVHVELVFDFIAPDKRVMTRRQGAPEQPYLEPGDETTFHAYIQDNARSVWVTIGARDKRRGELRVSNAGPFPIE